MDFKLRPWQTNDLESLIKNGLYPEIARYMSDGFPDNAEKWKNFLEFVAKNNQILYFAIEYQEEVIGGIGVHFDTGEKRKNAELGYWLSKPFWGKGIMSKAVSQMIQITFNTYPDIERIYAQPFGNNKSSVGKKRFYIRSCFKRCNI